MEQVLTAVKALATPQSLYVIGLIGTAWICWKGVAKGIGLASILAQKLGFVGLVATVLFIGGMSGAGYGGGEISCHNKNAVSTSSDTSTFDNSALLKLASDTKDQTIAASVLEYAKDRDARSMPSNADLCKLVQNCPKDKEQLLITYLNYLRSHQTSDSLVYNGNDVPATMVSLPQRTSVSTAKSESTMPLPLAYSLVAGGLASALIGLRLGFKRATDY